MSRKWILPVAGGGAALVVGYYIYTKVTAPAVPYPGVAGVLPRQTQPGIAVKSGRFDIFVPLSGVTDIIGAVRGGGTKDEAKREVPVSRTLSVEPHAGLPAISHYGLKGPAQPYMMPWM